MLDLARRSGLFLVAWPHILQKSSSSASVQLVGAAGLQHPGDFKPRHIVRRVSGSEIRLLSNLYKFLKPGELLANPAAHVVYETYWTHASSRSFDMQ